MRAAHSSLFSSIVFRAMATTLGVVVSLTAAHAQSRDASPSSSSPSITDAHAPTLALEHEALQPAGQIVQQPGDWRAANRAVAEFPRGHADVLKWEAAQPQGGAKTPAAVPKSRPTSHQHHMHDGAKP